MLLLPVIASAQLPLISGDTKIKFQKGDLTWLARVDTLAKYFASGPTGIYGGSGFVPNDTYARLSGANAAQRYFQLGYFPESPSTFFNRREAGLYFDDAVLGLINSDSIGNTQAYIYIQPNQMYVTANDASASKTGYVQVEPTQVSLVADSVRIGSLSTNNAALSVVGLNDATGVTYATSVAGWDRDASNDITGTISAHQVAVGSGANAVSGSDALSYETNTLRITPAARDTHFSIVENSNRMFGIQAIQDTFNGSVNAWKIGALRDKAGRVYLTGEELFVDGPLRQVTGGGIEFKGTTGSTYFHTNGDFYTGTLTGGNATYTRNQHWYFDSGGSGAEVGNPIIFQHAYEGNDTTGNCFEFLARNTASGGITHPDSTLFRIGNWDRGSAMSIRHNRNVGLRTNSPLYSLHINATDAMRVPTGTTAERPGSLQQGLLRFNTSTQVLEFYDGSDWQDAAGGGGGGESNTASNVGSGAGWYKQKTGVDLEFKTIIGGGGISVANNTSDLTVSTTAPQPASSETIEASNFTATMRRINLVDCSAGTITVTPPSSPAIGDRFAVVDAEATAATNNITIDFDTANQKLYAVEQNYIINVAGGYVEFIYMGTTTGWVATKG